jgi:CBS domain-containing protein
LTVKVPFDPIAIGSRLAAVRKEPVMAATERIEGSYRSPSFEKARVSDAMHPGVVSCTPETSLRVVAQIMAQRHIHSVVVTGHGGSETERGWGVISDVDLLRASSGDLDTLTAGEVAGTELPTVAAEESLPRAAQLMAEHEVTHLIVVGNGAEQAVGVISSLDIAGTLAWGRA